MYPQAFSLVSEEDPSLVFAVGLEIIGNDGEVDTAITYRPGEDGRNVFGTHTSADSARAIYSVITPLTLNFRHEPEEPSGVDAWSRDETDDA